MTLIGKQRIVIGMYDGSAWIISKQARLPAFRSMAEQGFFKQRERGFSDGHQRQQCVDLLRHMA